MDKVESCDHTCVRPSSGSASVAVPARATVSPSVTSWSVPAFTVGAVLALSVMVIMILSETVDDAVRDCQGELYCSVLRDVGDRKGWSSK